MSTAMRVDLVSARIAVDQLHAAQAGGFARLRGKGVRTRPQARADFSPLCRTLWLGRLFLLVCHEITLIHLAGPVKLGMSNAKEPVRVRA